MSKWMVAAKKADFNKIAEKYGITPVLARIIRNRDITGDDEIRKYLEGNLSDLYDPFLLKGHFLIVSIKFVHHDNVENIARDY